MMWRPLLLVLILGTAAQVGSTSAPAAPATATAPALTAAQRGSLERLRTAALGSDLTASRSAIKEIESWGPAGRRTLVDLLRQILSRDKSAMEQAVSSAKDPAKVKALQEQIDTLRAEASANVAKLEKGKSVELAHEHFKQLAELVGQLNQINRSRLVIADGLARRGEFLPLYRSVAPANDTNFKEAAEKQLTEVAEKALGMSAEALPSIPGPEDEKGPSDPAARRIWFYRSCRALEAYNAALAQSICDKAEFENLRFVNQYRECLGIMPFELDARLVQAARRHSKEMADLKYFAHASPTESEKSHVQRMRNAGYGGGYSENIANGPTTGERAFWMWFDSPGHHKNIAGPANAIGIGRWGRLWTQNMGRGKRLLALSPEDRAKVEVQGTILKPDALPTGMERPVRMVVPRGK